MTLVVALLVFVPMLVEALRSARNERTQLARGGIEPAGDVYELMRVAYPASFVIMMLEGAWRGSMPVTLVVGGASVFAIAKLLKWWAILTLGHAWTFRVIVVPGARLVDSGPYRFLRHPNYVGVIGEFVGVLLMTGAFVTGPVVTVAFIVLLLRRTVVEERSLRPFDKHRAVPSEAEGRHTHS
jgi:methyltransferase